MGKYYFWLTWQPWEPQTPKPHIWLFVLGRAKDLWNRRCGTCANSKQTQTPSLNLAYERISRNWATSLVQLFTKWGTAWSASKEKQNGFSLPYPIKGSVCSSLSCPEGQAKCSLQLSGPKSREPTTHAEGSGPQSLMAEQVSQVIWRHSNVKLIHLAWPTTQGLGEFFKDAVERSHIGSADSKAVAGDLTRNSSPCQKWSYPMVRMACDNGPPSCGRGLPELPPTGKINSP